MTVRVTWLGHATVRLELAGTVLLTDPLLRAHAGLLRRNGPPPAPGTYADVAAVLLSHLHLDHADVPSLRMLGGATVVTGPTNAPWVDRRTSGGVLSPVDWQRIPGTEVDVRLVRADHHHRPMPHRPNDAHGFLVRGGGVVVWFAGDTSLHAEMADLEALAGAPVDLALLPVGGWGPRLGAGHMGPPEALEALRRSGSRAVLPIHAGTVHPVGLGVGHHGDPPWSHRPLEEFEALAATVPSVRFLRLDPGEQADL